MEETTNVNLDRSSIILSRSARLLAKNESDKARKRPITISSVHRLFACQCLSAAGIRGKPRAQAHLKNILVGAEGNCSDSHPISPRDVATALLSSAHTQKIMLPKQPYSARCANENEMNTSEDEPI
jgi:hypothetical protein